MRKCVFFWRAGETLGYLSNWYISNFEIEGKTFCCVEQYMMYKKALLFEDYEVAEQVMKTNKPIEMKALGRHVRNYKDTVWSGVRYGIVRDGIRAKFTQNKILKGELMRFPVGTVFVEASPYDTIWGIGLGDSVEDESKWRGQNLLGKAISEVRKELG